MAPWVQRAFVLGAGVGKRLRPLTDELPKPLVPIYGKPLMSLCFDHLMAAGVREFVVNTHHCAKAYRETFGVEPIFYKGNRVHFVHEPILLDTGGGLKNVECFFRGGAFFLHNGDILADLDLVELAKFHWESGSEVTLGLRCDGGPRQVMCRQEDGRVVDIRGRLGGTEGQSYVYSGVAVLSPTVFDFLMPGVVESVVEAWLRMIVAGRKVLGRVMEGRFWADVGTVGSYFRVHRELAQRGLSYEGDLSEWPLKLDPTAELEAGCRVEGFSVVGFGARVGAAAILKDSIVWPEADVMPGIELEGCVVRKRASRSAKYEIL